jgi:aminoglycoside phosphotransferase (APT) family kinase protein
MAFYEEYRASDISKAEVFDALCGFFPDIKDEDIKFFYHGTHNVFEVKNQYILRVPTKAFRNQIGVRLITNEIKMLHHIQKYVSVQIPDPIYISIDPDCPFMGYEKIEGIALSRCFNKLSRNQKIRIADDIGKFLTTLHSDEVYRDAIKNQIVDNTFSCAKYQEEWENYFEKIQKSIFYLMNEAQKKWIITLFNDFLMKEENFNFNYSIIHGDFDITNIVVDSKTYDIRGIVDFEESRVYDPAADFIFFEEGDDFMKHIFSSYKKGIDDNFEERMKFLYGRGGLGYIQFGLKNNLKDMIETGFQLLHKRMKRFPNI